MKKIIISILACLIITGCSSSNNTSSAELTSTTKKAFLEKQFLIEVNPISYEDSEPYLSYTITCDHQEMAVGSGCIFGKTLSNVVSIDGEEVENKSDINVTLGSPYEGKIALSDYQTAEIIKFELSSDIDHLTLNVPTNLSKEDVEPKQEVLFEEAGVKISYMLDENNYDEVFGFKSELVFIVENNTDYFIFGSFKDNKVTMNGIELNQREVIDPYDGVAFTNIDYTLGLYIEPQTLTLAYATSGTPSDLKEVYGIEEIESIQAELVITFDDNGTTAGEYVVPFNIQK